MKTTFFFSFKNWIKVNEIAEKSCKITTVKIRFEWALGGAGEIKS